MTNAYASTGLSVRQAAWLLTMSEQQIRYRLRTGRLKYMVRPSLITIESVRALFPDEPLREVRERVLGRLLRGEVEAPATPTPYAKHSIHTLIAATLIASLPRPLPKWWGRRRT